MAGETTLMELYISRKSIIIMALFVFFIASIMGSFYTTFRDSFKEDLEGAENVDIEVQDMNSTVLLSWKPVKNADYYIVLADNRSTMLSARVVYMGSNQSVILPYNSTEKMYYAIMAQINGSDGPELVGMATTTEEDPFEELLSSPMYTSFTGGREISFGDIKGFLSLEFYSVWWIYAGIYLAYFSASMVADDYRGKRMDLIFSTPLSRERYLIEKFIAGVILCVVLVLAGIGGLMAGVRAIGMEDEFTDAEIIISLVSSIGLMLTIVSSGILSAVIFKDRKGATGLNLVFLFSSFMVYTVSSFSDAVEWLKYLSILNYWDYHAILFDGEVNIGYTAGLIVFSIILLSASIHIFRRQDMPA